MTTLTYRSRPQPETTLAGSAFRTLVAFMEGARDGLAMSDHYHALARMSDEQLAKRGLRRADIARAVVLGRGRR